MPLSMRIHIIIHAHRHTHTHTFTCMYTDELMDPGAPKAQGAPVYMYIQM